MGALSAVGIDNDPVAIDCAKDYAVLNGFGQELDVRCCQVGALVGQSFEVIVANIDRKTILDMSHEFSKLRSSKTLLFLSGLLEEDDIVEMLSSLGWTQHAIRAREGWIALQFCVTSSA